jgi:hypothetical protein
MKKRNLTRKKFSRSGNLPFEVTKESLWTQDEDDLLLNYYFEGRGMQIISKALGRGIESLERRARRLIMGERGAGNYKPGGVRISRKGKPFTVRELKVISKALLTESYESKLHSQEKQIKQLARVMNRSSSEIREHIAPDRVAGFELL